MKELKLTDIVKNINAECDDCGDRTVTGVSTDTRTIKEGDLFFALSGENFDGHNYVETAVEKGAVAVVCSKETETAVPVLMVDDTLAALQRLAAYYKSLLDIKVVAVTGSNGKTTTRDMTAAVLSSKYKVYSTAKNYNNEIGLPKSVLELDDSYDIAVLEMGMNHFGEISKLTNIAKPDVAVITNIGMAHIGNLGSQENILKAKLEILEGLKQDGLLVLNGDDAYLRNADTGDFEKQLIGIESNGLALGAENIQSNGTETVFEVIGSGESEKGSIPVLGRYNVLNALEAMCVGLHFGVKINEAFQALAHFRTVGMRCETEVIKGVTVVKDYYNSSPDSSRVALETLKDYTKGGKQVALLGEMLELGEYSEAQHRHLGEMCRQNGVNEVYFIGDDWEAFRQGFGSEASVFKKDERDKMENAVIDFVKSNGVKAGDVVLVKGSRGMKMEHFYETFRNTLENL